MQFNEYQNRLWHNMITLIENFRKGKIQYSNLVYGLEGAFDAGEFENEIFVKQWYDYWTPLEILSATKGDDTTLEDLGENLSAMEIFLEMQISS